MNAQECRCRSTGGPLLRLLGRSGPASRADLLAHPLGGLLLANNSRGVVDRTIGLAQYCGAAQIGSEAPRGELSAGTWAMARMILAAVAIIGLVYPRSVVVAELDLSDRPAMMQLADNLLRCVITFNFMALETPKGPRRKELQENARDYSTAVLHLYKLLQVLDAEALARRRWNAVFEHVKSSYDRGRLNAEMTICTSIEPLQKELLSRWQLEELGEDK